MSALESHAQPTPRLVVDYVDDQPVQVLAQPDTLAVFAFGAQAPVLDDPRYLRVALQPHGAAPLEVWRGQGPVQHGRDGDVAWAEDGALQFGAIELDEPVLASGDGDIESAAEAAYRRLAGFIAARGYPHLLRMWNYVDAITAGDGDGERYRRFCVGRARALGAVDPATLPAATAIGRIEGRIEAGPIEAAPIEAAPIEAGRPYRLQVYWLAAREPGTPLENPRQVSAYRYPRQYGPQSPGFARAMLAPVGAAMPLLLSGTAAIVGHESQHHDSVAAQLDEVLANLASLIARARAQRPALPEALGAGARLKVYVRDAADTAAVQALLEQRLPSSARWVVLHGAVCRRELRVEIDGVHG